MPADQQTVLEFYRDAAGDAATMGDYVYVQQPDTFGTRVSCFGPVEDEPDHGWKVVMIDWDSEEFIMAPITEVSE